MQVRSMQLRVLIADTDCRSVAYLAQQLEYWGHEVHAAADGGAALAALRLYLPDVLLLGLDLPGLDALTVVRTVRRERARRSLVVVAFSADPLGPHRLTSVLKGVDHILCTPVDAYCLREILTRSQESLIRVRTRTQTSPMPLFS